MSSAASSPAPADTTVTVGGLTFTALAGGPDDGPLVVLLHGYPQTRHTWRDQVPALAAAGYRAVAPDQRGYSPGARPAGIDPYSTDHLVADVITLADHLAPDHPAPDHPAPDRPASDRPAADRQASDHPAPDRPAADVGASRRFHLVGHDWGGQVAWLTALAHPDRLASLTVLSRPHPAAFTRSFRDDPAQAERSKHHKGFDDPDTGPRLLADGARRVRAMLSHANVPDADIDAYLTVLGHPDAMEAALAWYRAASRTGGLRLADAPPCRVPTLYLWGVHDQSVGRRAAELTAEHVTAPYRLVELPGGHFLTDDGNTAAVTRELLAHLAAHPA